MTEPNRDGVPAGHAVAEPIRLDQVMLAMDVVDTLRHQHALVDAELDDEMRQQEFVRRVQAIYQSQGIEVSEAVVVEGVRALKENRFAYVPPARTFAVRLAEVYVERGKWARRMFVVLLLVGAVWAAFAVPRHYRLRGQVHHFALQMDRLLAVAQARTQLADELQVEWRRGPQEGDSPTIERLFVEVEATLLRGRDRVAQVREQLTPRPDPETYPQERSAWDQRVDQYSRQLEEAGGELGTARGLLRTIKQLRTLGSRLDVAMARLRGLTLTASELALVDALQRDVRAAIDGGDGANGERALEQLDLRIGEILASRQQQAQVRAQFASLATALSGVEVEAQAKAELVQLRQTIEQALTAGDWPRVMVQTTRLQTLVDELDRAYELRIVSRPNERSGVWRYEAGSGNSRRNYYIVVEAVDAAGKVLALPVTSEENQETRTVRRFAVRVPETVYQQVGRDKQDNGLIDDALFGSKRRGAREPEYRFPVAGGRITEW